MALVLTIEPNETVSINGDLVLMFKRHKSGIRVSFEGDPGKYAIRRVKVVKKAVKEVE